MDIRISDLGIEASKNPKVRIVHANTAWSILDEDAPPMIEGVAAWVLRDAEKHLAPGEQFKIAVIGFPGYGEAFQVYCARHDAGVLIGGPPSNKPEDADKMLWKFDFDAQTGTLYLLAPDFQVYVTPGGNRNSRMPLEAAPSSPTPKETA